MWSFSNQGEVVKCVVEAYTTQHPKHGRRHSPAIPAGTVLYCIKYVHRLGGYFTYSYLNKFEAEACIRNSAKHETNTEFFMEWNRVETPEQTLHVGFVSEG